MADLTDLADLAGKVRVGPEARQYQEGDMPALAQHLLGYDDDKIELP